MQAHTENTSINGGRSHGRQFNGSAVIIIFAAIAGIVGWVAFRGYEGDLTPLIDWRSGLVVLTAPVLILTGIFGWAAPIDAFFYVLGRRDDSAAARDAAQFFQLWAAFALACGFITTLVGIIFMLVHLDDPTSIGPGVAVALLSQLYGVCIAVACIICSVVVLRRYPDAGTLQQMARQAVAGAGVSVVAGTLVTLLALAILLLAFMSAN